MRASNFGFIQAVMMFALGLIVGGGVMGGMPQDAQAISGAPLTGAVQARCASDNAVANFVCRNTWLAHTRHNYR